MRLHEIKNQILQGMLKMESNDCGTKRRRKYIYSKTKGTHYGEYNIFIPDIERVETLTYPDIRYRAVYHDGRGYRISKKVYNEMKKKLDETHAP